MRDELDNLLDSLDWEAKDVSAKTSRVLTTRDDEKDEKINTDVYTKRADFMSFMPSKGKILGLDISKTSTGWCLIEDGVRKQGNITLTGRLLKEYPKHKELMYRVELKEELSKLFKGMDFDNIIIEDVFQGANARTVRLLYDINTAIDELIYEGTVTTKDFNRVSNQKWKSWLYQIDTFNETKGMLDKPRIQACMAMLGIEESGEGYQDRLDSAGMVAGYYINEATKYGRAEKKKAKFSLRDIKIRYRAEREDALAIKDNILGISDGPYEVTGAIGVTLFERSIMKNPDAVYITKDKVILGFLGKKNGIQPIEGGGYLSFWCKPSMRSKYKDK